METARLSWVLSSIGVGLVALSLVQFLNLDYSAVSTRYIVLTLVVIGGAGIGLIYIAGWHSERSFPSRNHFVILWMLLGGFVMVTGNLISILLAHGRLVGVDIMHHLEAGTSIGLLFGAGLGTLHVQAMAKTESAAKKSARVDALKEERDRLRDLNAVLRHYILNSVTAIDGHLLRLESSIPEDRQPAIDGIRSRTETITMVVDHAERLSPLTRENEDSEIVNLKSQIEKTANDDQLDVDIDLEPPDTECLIKARASIETDLMFFFDAVASVTESGGTIRCTCVKGTDQVEVNVTATPARLPQSVEETIFEPVDRHSGLKFFMADSFIDMYGGIRLERNSEDKVEFVLEFSPKDASRDSDQPAD